MGKVNCNNLLKSEVLVTIYLLSVKPIWTVIFKELVKLNTGTTNFNDRFP